MSFIRAKQIPPRTGNWYDYEVETYHENGHVRQRVLKYLGLSGRNSGKSSSGSVSPPRPIVSTDTKKPTYTPIPKPAIHPVACKHCQSENIKKYGTYKGVQNYFCNDCHTKFTGTDALPHGRVSPQYIASALNNFYTGSSFHDIENDIDNRTNEGVSHTAVIKWVNKYTAEAIKATKDLQPKVGDTWIADETYVRVDKSSATVKNPYWHEKKEKWVIFWDIIDAKTRFLLASHVTITRSAQDAKALMEKAYKCAGKMPKVVVTDKLNSYINGIKSAYGSHSKHVVDSPFEIENDSNLIERFHNSLKERTKVMRAQKNKTTLERFTDGWLVYYNFFRPHMSLDNKPPAVEAGLEYPYHSWADVVGLKKEPIAKPLSTLL